MIRWITTDPELLREWSDADLRRAYELTGGEPDDAEAEAILAEIGRRGLDL